MRAFTDAAGRQWDVAVSEASYGSQHLLFAARQGGELRFCEFDGYSRSDAERWLLELEEAKLGELLAAAREWRPG